MFSIFSFIISRKYLFKRVKSAQCYELLRRCSPLHLMLALLLTYAVYLWSVHCKYAPATVPQDVVRKMWELALGNRTSLAALVLNVTRKPLRV